MKLTGIISLAVLILLSGCVCVPGGNDNTTSTTVQAVSTTLAHATTTLPLDPKDVFSVARTDEPYYCTYSGLGTSMRAWIFGSRYYAKIYGNGKIQANVMSDGAWVYLWEEGRNTGIKYQISKTIGLAGDANTTEIAANSTHGFDSTIYDAAGEAGKAECNKTTIPEGLLSPPKIQFRTVKSVADKTI